VDDKAERQFIDSLEKQAGPSRSLYSLFREADQVPASLREEFELFRVMYDSALSYDLNTNLEKDPHVSDKREAVRRTIELIARTLQDEPRDIHLTLENYAAFIA
jgi:hypothetical protein